jgi:hypothetical protein
MRDTAASRCASIIMNANLADQAKARKRFLILMSVAGYCQLGSNKTVAVIFAAQDAGVATSTIWRWLRLVEGHPLKPAIWMRWLLPRPNGRKPHPSQRHLHQGSEILSLEEVLHVRS